MIDATGFRTIRDSLNKTETREQQNREDLMTGSKMSIPHYGPM
jgi:hypothetical protein